MKRFPQEFMLNLLLRIMRQSSFKSTLKHVHGKALKEHQTNFLKTGS